MRTSVICYNSPKFKFFFRIMPIIWLALFQLVVPAGAEQTALPDNIPVHISSDKMIAGMDPNIVEFIGNVEAIRDNSTLFADSIKVYFTSDKAETTDKEKEVQKSISKILAIGNIRYVADDKRAFADEAIYTMADEVLMLKGKNTRLETGESFITGNKITVFKQQDIVIVESDSRKRVQATLQPEDNPVKKK